MQFGRWVFMIALLLCTQLLQAQPGDTVTVSFHFMYGKQPLQPGVYFRLNEHDSLRITNFRFYISNIELCDGERVVYKELGSQHLLSLAEPESWQLTLMVPAGISFSSLHFQLGIDSVTNVSGAMGGDLDPTKGMYWTWQSGYINVKLEGNSNLCNSRRNEFEFHLGGYRSPGYCLQSVALPAFGKKMEVVTDLNAFFSSINLSVQHHLMTPGKEAVSLSEKLKNIFSTRP